MLRIASRTLWPLLTLALALVVTFLLSPQLPRSAAGPAEQLFNSPIRTSPTPTVTPTPDGLFRSILGTPQYVESYRQLLPLVRRDFTPTPTPTLTPTPIIYGWKGVGDTGEIPNANPSNQFWGLNPSWYYDWGRGGAWAAAHPEQAHSAVTTAEQMALAMTDPAYVPMIHCTDVVSPPNPISPQEAADLARGHPGRVWLIFNEPDLSADGDQCGTRINATYPLRDYYGGANYGLLGEYLAQQYIRYHDAIRAADPTARLFPLGGFRLPGAAGTVGSYARDVWTGFTNYLANPAGESDPTPRSLDGIAIHAYPNFSATCNVANATCLQQALVSTHSFYQNMNLGVAAQKSIWITEIGNLEPGGAAPGSGQGRLAKQNYTATSLTQPLLNWFTTNAVPGGSVPYFNGLAWFSTHDCRYVDAGHTVIKDYTASDLLYTGEMNCPLVSPPTTPQLTAIGSAWAAAECLLCACPGPDCQ